MLDTETEKYVCGGFMGPPEGRTEDSETEGIAHGRGV